MRVHHEKQKITRSWDSVGENSWDSAYRARARGFPAMVNTLGSRSFVFLNKTLIFLSTEKLLFTSGIDSWFVWLKTRFSWPPTAIANRCSCVCKLKIARHRNMLILHDKNIKYAHAKQQSARVVNWSACDRCNLRIPLEKATRWCTNSMTRNTCQITTRLKICKLCNFKIANATHISQHRRHAIAF